MKPRVLPEASQDLLDGFRFYEAKEEGLGSHFLECLFSDIDSLEHSAGMHASVCGRYRMVSRRFPFGIYYRIEGDTVVVDAVLDCRRDPKKIRKRLRPGR